jgi:hypothetical protein
MRALAHFRASSARLSFTLPPRSRLIRLNGGQGETRSWDSAAIVTAVLRREKKKAAHTPGQDKLGTSEPTGRWKSGWARLNTVAQGLSQIKGA